MSDKNRKKFNKLKEYVNADDAGPLSFNPYEAVLANPDLLSEYSRMYPERDIDDEEEREEYKQKLKSAVRRILLTMPGRQREVLRLLEKGLTEENIARKLHVSQPAISHLVKKIKKRFEEGVINQVKRGI